MAGRVVAELLYNRDGRVSHDLYVDSSSSFSQFLDCREEEFYHYLTSGWSGYGVAVACRRTQTRLITPSHHAVARKWMSVCFARELDCIIQSPRVLSAYRVHCAVDRLR